MSKPDFDGFLSPTERDFLPSEQQSASRKRLPAQRKQPFTRQDREIASSK
jgi:hypothetical protein